MEQFFDILKKSHLFSGIADSDLFAMLQCLGAKVVSAAKNEMIFTEGDPAEYVGMVLSGSVQVVQDDYYGNRSVITAVEPGEIFGEMFACAEVESLPVSAIAISDSKIMLMNVKRILRVCTNGCGFHNMLIENLLKSVAMKTLNLSNKIRFMSKKSTRDKLMAFLLEQAKRAGGPEFTIAFDRQALADFLGVERSAMSAELGKLRKAGILESKGSRFRLLRDPEDI